ncbi:MAG: PfkB family carbohydrate kinase [Kiritimatiellia bacterium]|nr:PfkB family carbohydrate kinase [Kiritimatiellia bacterium]
MPKIVIVGSLAYDDIATPFAARQNALGGSVSYACAASSFFSRCGMVAVAGTDFSRASFAKLRKFGIDLCGLQITKGKTFRWSGVYEKDFNNRRTLCTKLNVFESFRPELPGAYRQSPFLFLANIAPALQAHVMEQIESPRFVMADTMDLWINTARPALLKLIKKVDLLLLNDSEARHLSGENHLITAARKLLKLGPRYLIVKKGEHGSMLVSRNSIFLLPAFPVDSVVDPTGAGDSFAGGFIGCLATQKNISVSAMRRAMICGTITASFAVEAFSIDKLSSITRNDINRRVAEFIKMVRA